MTIDYKAIEKAGTDAVKKLRMDKLLNGIPFMINSKDLPSTECYIEYPDGHISLASLSSSKRDFQVIKELSTAEAELIRKRYNLSKLHA